MTRIVSYNILAGGYSLRANGARRVSQLTKIIRSAQPDIVGLVEATHPRMQQKPSVVEEIAETLGMQLIMGGESTGPHDYRIALLTRLPVIRTQIHPRPGILNKPLLEVCVEEADGQHLTVFVTHLSAAFSRSRAGDHIRSHEVQEILHIMAPSRKQGKPHIIMGDFNSLAPGDSFEANNLLRYIIHLDRHRRDPKLVDGHPHLNFVVPPKLRFLIPLLRIIPKSQFLCRLFDFAAAIYAPRGCIKLLRDAGYVDCYRHAHPRSPGFTCPAYSPAGRIDYIFASPNLAQRLEMCHEITEGEGLPGNHASDHLAVTAAFGIKVQPVTSPEALDNVAI